MRIEFLDSHRGQVATLAAWHHAEWRHLYDDWTLAVATAELADHATRRRLPTTLVLFDADALLGSVSLVLEDAPALQDRGSPWLASLYVVPKARGQGNGRALVQAAVALAAREQVPQLFLFTPDHADFYRSLGWRPLERLLLRDTPVQLMAISPAQAVAE